MQFTSDFFQRRAKVLTVTELTRSIRGTLDKVRRGVGADRSQITNPIRAVIDIALLKDARAPRFRA